MAITYTDNLHLAMQEDKSDNLDWDALTNNWKIIDAAIGGATITNNGAGVYAFVGSDSFESGVLQEVQ